MRPYRRVIFSKNPLAEVLCQLRVPQQLILLENPPAQLQELLKADYPVLQANQGIRFKFGGGPGDLSKPSVNQAMAISYDFRSLDGSWKVSVASDFIAVSTSRYTRWEEFSEKLQSVLGCYASVYDPKVVTRVGLRYRDVISRSALNLTDTPFSELLDTELLGAFHRWPTTDPDQLAYNVSANYAIGGDNAGRCQVLYGLAQIPDTKESVFYIDSDFSLDATMPFSEATSVLPTFNSASGELFQLCISEKLFNALDPQNP